MLSHGSICQAEKCLCSHSAWPRTGLTPLAQLQEWSTYYKDSNYMFINIRAYDECLKKNDSTRNFFEEPCEKGLSLLFWDNKTEKRLNNLSKIT